MRTKLIMGFCLLFAIIIINACENKQAVAPLVVISGSCDTTHLTYSSGSNTMQPIINTYCAINSSCHGSGSSFGDYTTLAGMQPNINRGWVRSDLFQGTPHVMPKSPQPPLDACTLAKFGAWLNAGAPQ